MSKLISSDDVTVAGLESWEVPEVDGVLVGRNEKEEENHHNRTLTASQLEEIQEQARKEAAEQGYQEGLRRGQQDIQAQVQHLQRLLAALARPFDELDESVEAQLVELSLMVARHLVRRELKTDPGQVIATVREALTALPISSREIRLMLHPEDAKLVREAFAINENEAQIQILDDPVQARGGCKVQTETSQIDASVETRLNAVIAQVLGGEREEDQED